MTRAPEANDARRAAGPASPPLAVVDLGLCGYREAWARQLALVEARKDGGGVDTLLLVEHPHVITVGRSQRALANVLAPGEVEVVAVERGGDVTYHGPGQLVAYPIIRLDDGERDLHRYLRNLEEAVLDTARGFGLEAGRDRARPTAADRGRARSARRARCARP